MISSSYGCLIVNIFDRGGGGSSLKVFYSFFDIAIQILFISSILSSIVYHLSIVYYLMDCNDCNIITSISCNKPPSLSLK